MKYGTQTPYAASYVIVQNEEGKIAFVLRKNIDWMNGYYGLPSGKTEKNESFIAGAIREAKEEIGIDVQPENVIPSVANSIKAWKSGKKYFEYGWQ